MDLGLDWYKKRDQGSYGLQAQEEPINKAIFYFEKALNEPTNEELASTYLMKCFFYKGTFVLTKKNEQLAIFQRGIDLGEYMLKKYPNSAKITMWYMVNLGKWANLKSGFSAATSGVAGKMKELSERVIALDPNNEEAGAYRALGILHFRAPNIPLIMSWPDKQKALQVLKQSTEVAPENPGNQVAYAEVLYGTGEKSLAIKILQKVIGKKPRKDLLLEDKMELKEAEELLKKFLTD
ncbi:MAG: hypothetical protein H6581_15565 [Bacteroidia bacterium]|nr:hypothetical protein [Bacteroidia bacterium]